LNAHEAVQEVADEDDPHKHQPRPQDKAGEELKLPPPLLAQLDTKKYDHLYDYV
jgi:hypothetical protein